MRLYTRQLACFLLLFSALGAVGAAATPVRVSHTHMQALLARAAETFAGSTASPVSSPQNAGDPATTALPTAPHDIFRSTPATYPPASQAAATHAVTGLMRA